MSNKPRAEIPGDIPVVKDQATEANAGIPAIDGDNVEGKRDQAKADETERAVPGSVSLEDLQREIRTLQRKVTAQEQAIANKADEPAAQPKAVSMAKAKEIAQEHIDDGRSPPAVLTTEGWHVHPLTHSGIDDVEKQQERDAKQAAKAKKAD